MKKKFIFLAVIILFFLSCTQVEIITDPYWVDLVPSFQAGAVNLKIRSIINGYKIKLYISDRKGSIQDFPEKFNSNQKKIVILSPLLSNRVSSFSKNNKNIVYYFPNKLGKTVNPGFRTEIIKRDRSKSFFAAGSLLGAEIKEHSILPVIYDPNNNLENKETMSFLDGVKNSKKKISFIYLRVGPDSSEADVGTFYDQLDKDNIKYVAIFSPKFKYFIFDLVEKDNLQLITSDSWFSISNRSLILYSIEDDIEGMLKKVYSSDKTGKYGEILLEGVIRK